MLTFALFAVLAAAGHSQGLADLAVNPDDIMLRRPSNAAAERAAAEKAAAEKAAAEKAAAEKAAAERAAAERAAAEKAAAERAAAEKAAAERAAAEKAAAEKAAAEKAAAEKAAAEKAAAEKAAKKAKAKQRSGRPAVITAERTDYDRKEGVILFDRNVHVDDEQYQMHADRLFVFLDGTNDLKRLVALGNVAITNEEKTAECAKAVYTRALQRIVMYGDGPGKPARLRDAGGKKGEVSEVRGGKITYGIDSGLATVEQVEVELPAMKGAGPKDLFGIKGREKAEDKK